MGNRKNAVDYYDAYKRCKKCILNILEGRNWNEKNKFKDFTTAEKFLILFLVVVMLAGGEMWHYFNYSPQRGYRYYRLKVSSDIDRRTFLEGIYPYCFPYCREIEWI